MEKISHCEHPRLVYNKYIGRKVLVSCGKCSVCQSERRKKWIAKMIQESKCHKYVRVIQLDYNDEMIPRYDLVDNFLVEQQPRFHKGEFSNFVLDLKDINLFLSDKDDYEKEYFYSRLYEHRLGIPHCSVQDIQNFKKRLNTYVKREVTGKYQNFRSAIVAEYGPTTFRPHYHGILWFDDERICSELQRLCDKAWTDCNYVPFGRCKVELDKGRAGNYISKYICKSADIPVCYSYPAFRTFFLTSRRPPLGSLFEFESEVREIFLSGSLYRTAYKDAKGITVPISVPLGKALEDRLYPRLPLYSTLSPVVRTELYKSVIRYNGLVESFDRYLFDVFTQCYDFTFDKLPPLSKLRDWKVSPICDFKYYKYGVDLMSNYKGVCKNSDFARIFDKMTDKFTSYHFPLSVYRAGVRVWYQSQIFGLSFDEYLNKIYDYYNRKDLAQLKSFYQKESKFLLETSENDYRCLYPITFMDDGVPPDKVVTPNDCISSKMYIRDCRKDSKDVLNTKVKSAYLDFLKEKDFVLFNKVKDYYGKKCDENAKAIAHAWT